MNISRPSLLVTDDDRDFRETVVSMFIDRGFDTYGAVDGAEAVEFVRSRDVHLLLLDMHMPRMTGLEALIEVKKFNSKLPCIILSAALDEEITSAAEAQRAFAVASKPVSPRELNRLVEQALQTVYNWSA